MEALCVVVQTRNEHMFCPNVLCSHVSVPSVRRVPRGPARACTQRVKVRERVKVRVKRERETICPLGVASFNYPERSETEIETERETTST